MASWDKKLLTAAEEGNIKEVKLCVKNRANLECRDWYGLTPLMLAAVGGHLEVVMYLVSHGSQLEATDPDGWTPLMWAARGGHLEVVTFLVTHESQLEVTDEYGRTALHLAAQFGGIDVTKWLTDQGCSPWVKTKEGNTPYDLVKIYRFDNEERKRKLEEVMDFLKTVMSKTSPEVSSDTHSQEPAAAVVEGMKSPFLNENWLDHEKIFDGKSALQFINVTVGAVSGISVNTHSTKEKVEGFDIDMETVIETYNRIVQSENVSTFSSNAPVFSNDAHLQETRLRKVDKERTRYRLSRRMYNQIAVTHIPFQPGDSGTCIYVCDNSLERYGCIGMAIANHPGIDGGAIVTPMKDILKTFHLDIK